MRRDIAVSRGILRFRDTRLLCLSFPSLSLVLSIISNTGAYGREYGREYGHGGWYVHADAYVCERPIDFRERKERKKRNIISSRATVQRAYNEFKFLFKERDEVVRQREVRSR